MNFSRLQSIILATFLVTVLAITPAAEACTGLRLIAKNDDVIVGRTMEFGFDVRSNVLVIPKKTNLTTTINDEGKVGFTYQTKHDIVGANVLDYDIIVDGINDAGLYVSIHYFPGYASYPDLDSDGVSENKAMAPHEYATWLLAEFADVEEVKANFNKVSLLPVFIPDIDGPAPIHVVVHDVKGNSVVIEPIDKELKLFNNPLGVFTNSPSFDWHMTNLNNYVNLTLNNVPNVVLRTNSKPWILGSKDTEEHGFTLKQLGQGSGLHGLPGDITPPSRFVRAVAYSQGAIPPNKAQDGVPQVFHIMNAFDIPVGSARGPEGADYTVWTSVSDLKNQDWYFRTYKDQTIRRINLKKAIEKANGKMKYINMDNGLDYKQPFTDVSNEFFCPE